MFDFSGGELAIIAIVALVAIGPKELPGVLRMVGQWVGKARRMAREFQDQFHEALREAEVADLKKQFDETVATAESRDVFNATAQDIKESLNADPSSATTIPQAESPATEVIPAPQHQPAPLEATPAPLGPSSVTADVPKPADGEVKESDPLRTGTHS